MRLPPLPAVDHTCPACGFSYAAGGLDDSLLAVHAGVAALRDSLTGAGDEVRRRPAAGGWSAVEYLAHVRDVLVTSSLRLHRVIHEDRPVLEPMYNDWRAARLRYADEDVPALLDQLERAANALAEEVASVREGTWARTGGRYPDEQRPAAWFVRHAAHEVTHHLQDVRALLAGG